MCEDFATSYIDSAGEIILTNVSLEPSYAGLMGYSPSAEALVALAGPVRNVGTVYTQNLQSSYSAGSNIISSLGNFQLQEAVGSLWRCLGLYEPATGKFPFIFQFDAVQVKDTSHRLQIVFNKTWTRQLLYVAP